MPSALLVDLENVRLGLPGDAGRRFAEEPLRWVDWLAAGQDGGPRRSFVVQRCYLAHESFPALRAPLTQAGFEVVDCSVAPESGKNSADIRLVVDAMDLLHSSDADVEEFVVVSADADVLPLLHRLRSAGRGRTLVAGDGTRPGYVRVADRVVPREELAQVCGSDAAATGEVGRQKVPQQRTPAPARAVLKAVRAAAAPLHGGVAAQAALAVDPDLINGWAGKKCFRRYVESHVPDVEWTPQPQHGHLRLRHSQSAVRDA